MAVAYALSFAYVGIYWVNHHRLFSHATRVTNTLLWSNLALMFALSLVPFATAYLGEHHFTRDATIVYLVTLILPAIAYTPLQNAIRATGARGAAAARYHQSSHRKGMTSTVIYALGIPLSFVAPWLGIVSAALVAILWFLPKSPLDALFERG